VGTRLSFPGKGVWKLLGLSLRRGEDRQVGRRGRAKLVWEPGQEAAGRHFSKADPLVPLKISLAYFFLQWRGSLSY